MRKIFNNNWTFLKMGIDTGIEQMRQHMLEFKPIEIPHDFLIYDTANLYEDAMGWYRKVVTIHKKPDEKALLYFEGVYMDATIYVNGKEAFQWKYGYSSFEVDITPYLLGGEEEILVAIAHKSPNTRWYSGAGIYRDVYLRVVPKTHLVTDSLYISAKPILESTQADGIFTEKELAGTWEMQLSAEVAGLTSLEEGKATEVTFVLKRENQVIAKTTGMCSGVAPANPATATPWTKALQKEQDEAYCFEARIQIENPDLWDVEHPNLYEVEVSLQEGKDSLKHRVGFKTTQFNPQKGFFLNGKWLKLHGACEHHDLGALGAAYRSDAMRRKIKTLKEMGVNALRTTHNMPASNLMDLTDEMGMLVVSEAFDMWEMPKTTYDYARFFKDWAPTDVASWVRRDRNHASLLMWSIGNEIYDTHFNEHGYDITVNLKAWVEENDPRGNGPVTIGSNFLPWDNTQKCVDHLKLAGYNYLEKIYDEHHEKYPDWVIYGSETASVVHSRGIYHFPLNKLLLADDDEQCSALGNSTTSWGAESVEKCITDDRDAQYCMGQFIWTGFDYIGEPTPYKTKNSYFGQIDTAGFPKDAFYTFQAEWTDYKVKPMVHLFPYWDFNQGQQIDVRVCSNCPKVELFWNGKSLGLRQIDHVRDKHLIQDWQINYEKGTLLAVAYDENGVELAREEKRSFTDTAALSVAVDRETVPADGRSLAFVTITALDESGLVVENAADYVTVEVTGAGRLLGLDNGDSTDYDSYKGKRRKLFGGKLLAIVAAGKEAGLISVNVKKDTGETYALTIKTNKVETPLYLPDGTWIDMDEVPVCEANTDTLCPYDAPWIRKIDIVSERPLIFTADTREIKVKAVTYPTYANQNVIWSAVTYAGIASPIAKVESLGKDEQGNECALVIAKADGEFMLRCSTDNGTGKIKLISQMECKAKGLGKPFLDPYEFVTGGLCNCSVGDIGNGNEKGVSSGHERSEIGFVDVDFGEFGSDEITIPIFALDDKPYRIEIWEGMTADAGSEKLADVIYQKPSIWAVYQPETYKLSRRLKGLTTLCLVFYAKVHVKGFVFSKPVKGLQKLTGSDLSQIYGDSFAKEGNQILGIGNNVAMEFADMDFGCEGVNQITICGRTPLDANTIHLRFTKNGETKVQIVEFAKGLEWTEQTFALDEMRSGEGWKLEIVFLPGSNFDFGWFQFH
ncbi:MAG: DUF4982 domain-containing protein [Lachnospiraceae bacterium]|nr:DUF4982 domain-containing protein [Lachnospiraceae bacterium]